MIPHVIGYNFLVARLSLNLFTFTKSQPINNQDDHKWRYYTGDNNVYRFYWIVDQLNIPLCANAMRKKGGNKWR